MAGQTTRKRLGQALATLDELQDIARAEQAVTGEYIRPVMLIQAEAKSKETNASCR
ncbi:hypothetical protein Q1W73_16950 [Asticcacaulis sp. ZE23SCel15]|uniref:hypothetical protein n=1 Tax=Asticcacaulis sp. ZE23SCel15 TaxID=3059027 RepID=UPI00265F0E1D|nr:hypothetical protein [Asticcacaulis sp. ZE23SCel15]WKL57331.1 hypothetical protein Q1W73_16950 [Asticcacaulis sp. ZE23SCel15]